MKKPRLYTVLLVIIPVWLLFSGVFALVNYFRGEKIAKIKEGQRFAKSVSIENLSDDLKKIITVIGERNTAKPGQLSATAAMIRGILGPSNTGYEVKTIKTESAFPILLATLPSLQLEAEPIWILTTYDSPRGSNGAEQNATGVAATIAAAQAMAADKPARPIHFVLLPHGNEVEAPLKIITDAVVKLIRSNPAPKAVLCVEAMGDRETLIFTSQQPETVSEILINDLGLLNPIESQNTQIISLLTEQKIPSVRVSTIPLASIKEKKASIPFPPTLAASTGRLIEYIQRLSK